MKTNSHLKRRNHAMHVFIPIYRYKICNKYKHVTVINSKHYRMYNTMCKLYENKYIYVLIRTSN